MKLKPKTCKAVQTPPNEFFTLGTAEKIAAVFCVFLYPITAVKRVTIVPVTKDVNNNESERHKKGFAIIIYHQGNRKGQSERDNKWLSIITQPIFATNLRTINSIIDDEKRFIIIEADK